VDGDRIYLPSTRTKADALRELEDAKQRCGQGVAHLSGEKTLAWWLQTWLFETKAMDLSDHSRWNYVYRCQHVVEHLGRVRLDQLTPAAIQRCYLELREGGLAPITVFHIHTTLKAALKDATTARLIAWNPCDAVKAPKVSNEAEFQTLSPAEVETLLVGSRDRRFHDLWQLLVTTGLRIGEALALEWQHLDLDGQQLYVRQTLRMDKGGGYVFTDPKTKASRRTVPLSSQMVTVLRARDQTTPLVFCCSDGRPVHTWVVSCALERDLADCGLPRLRTHDLRHTAATIMLHDYAMPVKVVSRILGHSNIRTTLQTYAHVLPEQQERVAMKMGELLE
jgi:integrase